MSAIKSVLYLGSNGFPFGMAVIQRQLQISKAIQSDKFQVTVLSRKGVHSAATARDENIIATGTFEGINYVYTSGSPVYPSNFIIRSFFKIIGTLGELWHVLHHRLAKNLTCVIVNTTSLSQLKYYRYVTRLINVPLIYDYVEYMSSLSDRTRKTFDDTKTFDTQFYDYTDKLIIISSYLEKHIKKNAPHLPYIIIPPIIDFEKFRQIKAVPAESDYFLYCGSSQYRDIIDFILSAYRKSKGYANGVSLVLVIHGDPQYISELQNSLALEKNIKILSGLPYESLIGYYKIAKALLIPLQDNLQDQARFPFKISEYTAAARPIVTSNSGAIVDYFEDGFDALLAITSNIDDFADKLDYILENPDQAERIAINGYKVGLKKFNYKSYSTLLNNFILTDH